MRPPGISTAVGAAGGLLGLLLVRRWVDAVEVRGESMAPTLRPGELLLVERLTFARRNPRPGDVVLAADPRLEQRELVKRVASVDPVTGRIALRGDNPDRSTDSRAFGDLPSGAIAWRAAFRYWPPRRVGRL